MGYRSVSYYTMNIYEYSRCIISNRLATDICVLRLDVTARCSTQVHKTEKVSKALPPLKASNDLVTSQQLLSMQDMTREMLMAF